MAALDPPLSAEAYCGSLMEQYQAELELESRRQSEPEENRGEESVVNYNQLVSFMLPDSFFSPWTWEVSDVASGENQESRPTVPWGSVATDIPLDRQDWLLSWWIQVYRYDAEENQELPSPWQDNEDSSDDLYPGEEDSSSDACFDDEGSSSGGGNQYMILESDSLFSYTLDEILRAIGTMELSDERQ